jgi:xylulokinase/erythritol kinase
MTGVPTYLGIDAGTSVVKAVLLDGTGQALAVHGRELPLQHGSGDQVEQDVEDVLTGLGEVVREVLRHTSAEGHAAPELVAVTAQGDGCWLVDEEHRPAVEP